MPASLHQSVTKNKNYQPLCFCCCLNLKKIDWCNEAGKSPFNSPLINRFLPLIETSSRTKTPSPFEVTSPYTKCGKWKFCSRKSGFLESMKASKVGMTWLKWWNEKSINDLNPKLHEKNREFLSPPEVDLRKGSVIMRDFSCQVQF